MDPFRLQCPHRLALLAATLAGGLTAAVLLIPAIVSLDASAVAAVHGSRLSPAGDGAAFAVTGLGDDDVVLAIMAAGALGFLALGRRAAALTLVLTVLATKVTVMLLKLAVARHRPDADAALTEAPGFSFPSGHSAGAIALYATLGFLLARELPGRGRAIALGTGIALAIGVGLSRVYLGAHYPTDVLAGWITGAGLAAAAWSLSSRRRWAT